MQLVAGGDAEVERGHCRDRGRSIEQVVVGKDILRYRLRWHLDVLRV